MKDLEQIIKEMPVGLERSLCRKFSFHRGDVNMIERDVLLQELRKEPGVGSLEDRQMRLGIERLRRQGIRICHRESREMDINGNIRVIFGYYLAKTETEYNEFRIRYGRYAKTINDTILSMDAQHAVVTETGEIEIPPEVGVQLSF